MSSQNLITFLIGFGIITIIFGILIIFIYFTERPSKKREYHVPCALTGKDVSYLEDNVLLTEEDRRVDLKHRIIK